jgi:molecular chaperone GrpE
MGSSEPDTGDRDDGADEVRRLCQALEEEQQRYLRLRADLDNVRRRAALRPLLPVLDTLERALAAGSTDRDFYQGVAAMHRLFLSALREAGAEPVESIGRPFDPEVHEAVATVPSNEVEPGTVTGEVRRGWWLGEELLRPAQVVVVTSPEAASPWR